MSQDQPGEPEALISVDVEASGETPSTGSLIAIGACPVDDPERGFYVELQPLPDRPWRAEAERVHGLSRSALEAGAMDPASAMASFAGWVDEVAHGRHPVFVGFNAPFDWMFVADYFHRYLGRNPFGISALDLKALYMGRHGIARWSETRRPFVADRYGLPATLSHHALDDARSQAEVARRLLDGRR
jgi:DNA polymerase III epsilon subunit-like protein